MLPAVAGLAWAAVSKAFAATPLGRWAKSLGPALAIAGAVLALVVGLWLWGEWREYRGGREVRTELKAQSRELQARAREQDANRELVTALDLQATRQHLAGEREKREAAEAQLAARLADLAALQGSEPASPTAPLNQLIREVNRR